MHDPRLQPELAPTVRAALATLRGRIRRYLWLQGLGWLAAGAGILFWGSLAIDWFFEPPPPVRIVLLAAFVTALGWVFMEVVLRPAFVRLTDRSMAMLLERYFPQFNESLLTTVELAGRRAADCNPEMLAETCRRAAEPIAEIDSSRVFNFRPLRRSLIAAVLLAASVGGFAVRAPGAIGVWTRRSLLMSEELWPRKTRLTVEGFPAGMAKVARGADLTVVAKADLDMPLVPAVVKVRYRTAGGRRHQETMAREGTAEREKERFQEYSYTFQGVLTPIRFDVVGGDDAVRNLQIEVVDNPAVVQMLLDCRFPDYMERPPRTLSVAGATPIPAGSTVTVRAVTNKDLERVQVDLAGQDAAETVAVLDLAERAERRAFAYTAGDLREDVALLFTLHDTDGIKSQEPLRLTLIAVADEPPNVAVQLRGIGSAITPEARLPAAGRVADDHGLDRIWFEHSVDDGPAGQTAVDSPRGHPTEMRLDRALEARGLGLSAGQRLLVSVKASDRYDLGEAANVGSSERWLLDVVTPQQLRTMLESRELVLRQRFEAILAQAVESRDLLAGIQFLGTQPAVEASNIEGEAAGGELPPGGGAEPGDLPEAEPDVSPERRLSLRTLRVQRALQNAQKDSHEIFAVALGFEGIREELINNRIDTEELKSRLQEGIVNPLRRVCEAMYPELERRLSELSETLADDAAAPEFRDRAVAEYDAVLAALNAVLARMIELEDFNEAIALLREIIEAQEKIRRRTDALHKDRLRSLLED